MRKRARLSVIVAILYTLVVGTYLGIRNYRLNRDIDAVAHRAQVAADAEDMLRYMRQLEANMEQYGMTSGHTAVVFKRPDNNLSLLYKSVGNIVDRLEEVVELPKSSTAYQVALDDLRGTIRELESPLDGFLYTHNWPLYWLFGIWLWPLVHALRDDFYEY